MQELSRSQLRFRKTLKKKKNLSSSCKSFAKLNLFFRVLHKRPDGYHEIASLYQAIDLFDRLFFSFSTRDELSASGIQIPLDSSNLICKALSIYRNSFPTPPIQIHVEKNIPVQAGLGGGSSNAATTLLALNELMGNQAHLEQLLKMAAQLGSDVPFFFSSGTAICTGRGDIFEECSLPSPLSGWIAKPEYGLCTKSVYQNVKIEEFSHARKFQFFNDLEFAAFRIEPRMIHLQKMLKQAFKQVVMTGSGSAFFCLEGECPAIDGVQFFPFRSIQRTNHLLR
jgi:4-diphosphocytidyl-2-C-methyl-D-erythritol kinase